MCNLTGGVVLNLDSYYLDVSTRPFQVVRRTIRPNTEIRSTAVLWVH